MQDNTSQPQPSWREWLKENLDNHCAPRELYEIMLNNGFSDKDIVALMHEEMACVSSHVHDVRLAENRHLYQQLALAPLGANNPELQVVRFNSMQIQLYTIENFLSQNECETLIELSAERLRPSEVTHSNGDEAFRTSSTSDFVDTDSAFVDQIDRKIAETLGIRLPYSESIQVQRYEVGQEFKAHHDYFTPNTDIYTQFANEAGNRTWTFMVYLNTTPAGGETYFTEIDQVFRPKQGMAVVWNNLLPDGNPNPMTMHHGMPVQAGNKVIITKWFREKGEGKLFYI